MRFSIQFIDRRAGCAAAVCSARPVLDFAAAAGSPLRPADHLPVSLSWQPPYKPVCGKLALAEETRMRSNFGEGFKGLLRAVQQPFAVRPLTAQAGCPRTCSKRN